MHTLSMALYFLNKKILGTLGLGDALSEVARWFPDFFCHGHPSSIVRPCWAVGVLRPHKRLRVMGLSRLVLVLGELQFYMSNK